MIFATLVCFGLAAVAAGIYWRFITRRGLEIELEELLKPTLGLLLCIALLQSYMTEVQRFQEEDDEWCAIPPLLCVPESPLEEAILADQRRELRIIDWTSKECERYLRRCKSWHGRWPNPLAVLASDALAVADWGGQCVALFLKHQSVVVVSTLVALGVAMYVFWPYVLWIRAWVLYLPRPRLILEPQKGRSKPPPRPGMHPETNEIDGEGNCAYDKAWKNL